jgi:hypothetical protein
MSRSFRDTKVSPSLGAGDCGPAPATVIAKQFQAMVYLRTANSRMKDFCDTWLLASQFPFDGRIPADAIGATFKNRGTDFDLAPVVAFFSGLLIPVARAHSEGVSFSIQWHAGGGWTAQ